MIIGRFSTVSISSGIVCVMISQLAVMREKPKSRRKGAAYVLYKVRDIRVGGGHSAHEQFK